MVDKIFQCFFFFFLFYTWKANLFDIMSSLLQALEQLLTLSRFSGTVKPFHDDKGSPLGKLCGILFHDQKSSYVLHYIVIKKMVSVVLCATDEYI